MNKQELQRLYVDYQLLWLYFLTHFRQFKYYCIKQESLIFSLILFIIHLFVRNFEILISVFAKGIIIGETINYIIFLFMKYNKRKAIIMTFATIVYFLFYLFLRSSYLCLLFCHQILIDIIICHYTQHTDLLLL